LSFLYSLDPLFEYRFVPPPFVIDNQTKRRRFSLEKLFLLLSGTDDYVHLTDPASPKFLSSLREEGFEFGLPWSEGEFIPSDCKIKEWGDAHDLVLGNLIPNQNKIAISQYLNSKINQREWKEELGLSPLRTKLLRSEEQLIEFLEDTTFPLVLKGAYGIAGRNHIIIENQSQGWKLQQIAKKLFGFPIYAEEWVGSERILDFSTLWEFREDGPLYLGSTEMIVDIDGSFRGISMSSRKESQLTHVLPRCLEVIKAVYVSSEVKPIGPAAMDGFLFRKDTNVNAQVFSEINFRYSMGRILYEIRKKRLLKEVESGIVFLPLHKIKTFNEEAWLQKIKNEFGSDFFFVTPTADSKGKPFQTIGLYYQLKDGSYNANDMLPSLFQDWMSLA
jgi:hypothetical protein